MGHVLAIDLGTSNVKVAVVDRDGRVVASSEAPLTTRFTDDHGAEQDPEVWWQLVGACSRRAVGSARARASIEAVAVTSQYMSIVAVDDSGAPLAPAIMWMDRRGARHHPVAGDRAAAKLWIERHGLPTSGNDDQGHIAYLRQAHPDVYAATRAFVEPVDYLNARLTGRIAATQTTAFPLKVIDNRVHGTTEYDDVLVERAGLDRAQLPPLVAYDEILGRVSATAAEHLGVTTRAEVVTGTIDSITSAVGCGVLDCTTCSVIIGTTTVIVTHVDSKGEDLAHGIISVPSPLPGRYFVMAENGIGGKALDFYLRQLVYPDDPLSLGPLPSDAFERAESAALTVAPGSDGVLFLPWLVGSMAPGNDGRVRAGFVNVGLGTTRAHLTRAVYEGVALNAAWLQPYVAAFAGATWPSVRFGGGGASSALWAQILADALDVRIDQLGGAHTTNARGAAFLALERLGHISLADIPRLIDKKESFDPAPAAVARYRRVLPSFIDFHERNRTFYAALTQED